MLKLGARIKKVFWNQKFGSDKEVRQRVWKPLYRVGALTRGYAKRSIRRRARHLSRSRPGRPPFAHAPSRTGLKLIKFEVNKGRHPNVTIGPWKFRTKANSNQRLTTPQRHEHGGSDRGTKTVQSATRTYFSRKLQRHISDFDVIQGSVYYRQRPFMGPAFDKVKKDFPRLFKDLY